ncbi:MAG: uroporphyrinogen-III synthase [Pseudomonadota bacterium]
MNPSDVTLLLTRPETGGRRFAAEAQAQMGAFGAVVLAPLQKIVARLPFPTLPDEADLAFTSENAVRVAASAGVTGRKAFCVGSRTADAARAEGFDAESAGGDAVALANLIAARASGRRVVHLCGAHQSGNLAERLTAQGLVARRVTIYDQERLPLSNEAQSALNGPRPVLAPLFSPRSARLLADAIREADAPAPRLVAHLSAAVAGAWPLPARAVIATQPDAPALIAAMERVLSDLPSP